MRPLRITEAYALTQEIIRVALEVLTEKRPSFRYWNLKPKDIDEAMCQGCGQELQDLKSGKRLIVEGKAAVVLTDPRTGSILERELTAIEIYLYRQGSDHWLVDRDAHSGMMVGRDDFRICVNHDWITLPEVTVFPAYSGYNGEFGSLTRRGRGFVSDASVLVGR